MNKFLLSVGMTIALLSSGVTQARLAPKREQPSHNVPQGAALTGTVQVVGERRTVAPGERAAAVSDLKITLEGGEKGSPVKATFTVTLNTSVAREGTARFVDDADGSEVASAKKSGRSYVFKDVQFAAPGPNAKRVFRITNVRANAAAIGALSGAGSTPVIVANVRVSGATPIKLSNEKQAVANVK